MNRTIEDEELGSVVVVARARARADVCDLREEHVQHQEQQQRPDQLPQIAERGAVEADLPLHDRDVEGEVPEPPPVAGERTRPMNRPPERLVRGGLHAHARVRCPKGAPTRLMAERTGRSTTPPSALGPVTTNEKPPSKRSIMSSPEPAVSELEHGRVASGSEDVVEREGNLHLLAGVEVTGALVVHPGGGDDNCVMPFVVDVEAGGGIADVDRERHACLERHRLVLGNVREPLSDLVLQPDVDDPGLAISDAFLRPLSHRLRIATEVELEITVRHLLRVAQVHRIAALEQ